MNDAKEIPTVKSLTQPKFGSSINQPILTPEVSILWWSFCKTSTAHGLGHAGSSLFLPRRIFWVLLFLLALGLNLFHVATLIQKYLERPTTDESRTISGIDYFPDVTICNLAGLSSSNMQNLTQTPGTKAYKYFHYVNYNLTQDLERFGLDGKVPMSAYISAFGFLANIGHKEALQGGHKYKYFIISCSFGNKHCLNDSFSVHYHPELSNCYTFNGESVKGHKILPGPHHGLSLVLYLEEGLGSNDNEVPYDSFSNIANAAGARVVVHHHDTSPEVMSEGYDIIPAHSTSLGIIKHKKIQLPYPYSSCTEQQEIPHANVTYSSMTCLSVCRQNYVVEQCGCQCPEFLASDTHPNIPYCNMINMSDLHSSFKNVLCNLKANEEFGDDSEDVMADCNCPDPCTTYQYDPVISESFWPAEQYFRDFFNTFVNVTSQKGDDFKPYVQIMEALNSTQNHQDVQDLVYRRFARVNVYMRTPYYIEQTQRPAYDVVDLLTGIGGTLGLYAGISLLTLTEFIELLGKLISAILSMRNQPGNSP